MTLLAFASILLLIGLAALAWIDARTQRLPDWLTLPLIFAGLVVNTFLLGTGVAALIGGLVGYGVLVALELGFKHITGRDGLGRGDAKLLAAGGAWCTGWFLPQISLIGAGSALVFVVLRASLRRESLQLRVRIPFGPALALGIAACWLWRVYSIAPLL